MMASVMPGHFPVWTSVPSSFIDYVCQGFAVLEPLEISDKGLHSQSEISRCVIGSVRGKEYVFHPVKRVTGRQGLNLKNIQCRTTNTLLLERFHEGSFMHERSSPNVDYDGVGFH